MNDLAAKFQAIERRSPTRPHPFSPHAGFAGRMSKRLWSVVDGFFDQAEGRVIPYQQPTPHPTGAFVLCAPPTPADADNVGADNIAKILDLLAGEFRYVVIDTAAGLDEMTHGGFLRNSIMLVRGPTGSGKTMLAGVYSRAGAKRGERVVYYGFEEPRPTLIRNFEQVDLGIAELARAGNLKIVCRYPEATSLEDLLVDLRLGLEEFEPARVVMDAHARWSFASASVTRPK